MKRFPLLSFWVLGFLLSWAAWIPLALALQGRLTLPITGSQAQTYGAYGTAIAAILVTLAIGGIGGLQKLFSGLLLWRVNWRWYAAALFLPALISLLSTGLNLMQGGSFPDFAQPPIYYATLPAVYSQWQPWALMVPIFLQNVLFGTSLGEELAWRGFALPRLQQRYGPLKASLFIGLLWVLWQLPLTWMQVPAWARGQFVLMLVLGAIPAATILTWIYNKTGGSLLLVLLFNSATKMTDLFVTPSMGSALLPVIAYWLVALSILVPGGRKTLEPQVIEAATTSPAPTHSAA